MTVFFKQTLPGAPAFAGSGAACPGRGGCERRIDLPRKRIAPQREASIRLENLAGDEAFRACEPQRSVSDVLGSSETAERIFLQEDLFQSGHLHFTLSHGRGREARGDRV